MERLFNTNNVRGRLDIGGLWDFRTEDGSYIGKLAVPSCWEVIPALSAYKGTAEYSKKIVFGGWTRLVFKGVSHTAEVYLDGELIATHYNAYTPFSVDLHADYREHEISVRVDNSYSERSALHVENDYYTYGGIIRPVILESLGDAVINYIHFDPYIERGAWCAKISVNIKSFAEDIRSYDLKLSLGENCFISDRISLDGSTCRTFVYQSRFDSVEPYETDSPRLYILKAEISSEGVPTDDLIERVGFRQITIDGKSLLLNGKPIRLLGFNRHEDYNSLGSSVPLQAMMRDIALIKETGANSIRTCHYPNDELFLDLCDELGLLVWEEAHARGLSEEKMRNENFIPQSLNCIDEMIINHFNHPSIFCWGILNECVSDNEFGKECYKTLYDRISSHDSSRPKTSASNRSFSDKCYDLEDIVSVNTYPLWYDSHNESPKSRIDAIKNYIRETGNSEKPFIVSEIGAGAIYGYRTDSACKWSEQRQAQILDEQLYVTLSDTDICGVFIWQFCDVRVDESWFSSRPRCENNKGIVDEYRRKKLSFDVVKRHFGGK